MGTPARPRARQLVPPPTPTPVIVGDVRTTVRRSFVLFLAEDCDVRKVHLDDGSAKVHECNGLRHSGEHHSGLDGANTFDIPQPHAVAFGMGVTVLVQASIGFDADIDTRFIVATAGADFRS
jgi:hypothetical protein